jgi:hypothetical protein
MILNMRSIISNGPDSDDEAINGDNAVANEAIMMAAKRSSSNNQVEHDVSKAPFTMVDIEANQDNGLL